MPPVTRVLILTALLELVLALGLASAEAAALAGWVPPAWAAVRPAWIHLFVVGFVSQLIFGVAHWLFPPRPGPRPRGREGQAALAAGLLNAGLALRVVAEPLARLRGDGPWPGLLALGAGVQWLAVLLFALHLAPRLRGRRR